MTTSSLLFGAGLALLAVWFVARPFRGRNAHGGFGRAHSQRERLLRQKAALFAAIREIDELGGRLEFAPGGELSGVVLAGGAIANENARRIGHRKSQLL